MSFLGSGAKPQARHTPNYTGIQIQTSVYGKAIGLVYGATRISPNLIWYGDFQKLAGGGSSTKGGKGGGGGGKGGKGGSSSPNYQAAVMLALCEGPIRGIGQAWADKKKTTVAALGFSLFDGTYPQANWGYLTTNHPAQALGYNGVAYLAASSYQLGQSAQLPNHTFEVQGALYGTAPNGIDADPSQVVADVLTNPHYGLGFPTARLGSITTYAEPHTIPASPPYQATVANAASFAANLDVVDSSGNLYSAAAANPGAGQYSFTNGVYSFNAANAGITVTIAYTALGGLTNYRAFALASGLWISPSYDGQVQASSMLDDIATYTNSEWVWSSGVLTLVPRGTVAVSANGYSYTPPGAPLYNLTDDDFLPNSNSSGASSAATDDPVLLVRKRPADQLNDIKLEYLDRTNQYNTAIIEIVDQAMIDAFGRRFAPSQQAHLFADANAAHAAAQFLLQKQAIRNTYQFTLDQRYCLLDPMDIVTLTDAYLGLNQLPVRITEITENDNGTLSFAAEEYPAGLGAAALYSFQTGQGFGADYNAAPDPLNAPILFEPTDALAGDLELWIFLSGGPNWGGCQVWSSADGNTYALLGTFTGRSRMGTLASVLAYMPPAVTGASIDTADTPTVDISESLLQLNSGTQQDALSGNTLCYVGGEFLAYETATLVGNGQYRLSYLNRGMYGTTPAYHSAGVPFARIDGQMFTLPFTADRVGATTYFKFLSVNQYGGGLQGLAEVQPYAYTIQGTALTSPLPNIQNLTSSFIGNLTYLTWDEISDFRPVSYEVRKGGTWSGAKMVGRFAHPPIAALGDDTYWVAAYSQPVAGLQVYSQIPAEIVIAGSVIAQNIVESWDEGATGWTGTVGGAATVLSGQVVTGGAGNILTDADYLNTPDILNYGGQGSGTYEIPAGHEIDCLRAAPYTVAINWTSQGQILGFNMLAIADYLNTNDVLGYAASANTNIYPEIALSQDGVTWAAWQKWAPGAYLARKFKARMQIQALDPQTQAILESFVFSVNAPERDDHYINLAIASGGTSLSFQPDGAASPVAFTGGPNGATLPSVQVTILNATQGDTLQLTGLTLSGCTIKIVNAGAGVARSVNVLTQGF